MLTPARAATSLRRSPGTRRCMMNTTIRHPAHRGVAVAVLAASLAACGSDPIGAVRIRLRIGDDVAMATLEDSAPARDFASPVRAWSAWVALTAGWR